MLCRVSKIRPLVTVQVPFWWWTGDDLDEDRLLWQVRELHKKGISGVQVNYSHTDSPGWPSDAKEPAIFSDDWWKFYARVSEECGKLGMGIGLSTYTLDWDNGGENLFKKLFYDKPELNAIELTLTNTRSRRVKVKALLALTEPSPLGPTGSKAGCCSAVAPISPSSLKTDS